ncbi:MAG: hypothetical protein NVSMB3_02460 [Acidobacteriaceae bacterium]
MIKEVRERLAGTDSTLVTGILVTAILYFAREVFVPLAMAGLLAFLLAPAATQMERWGMKRAPAGMLVILLSLAGVGTLGYLVLGQIYNLAIELPQYQQNVTGKIEALHLNSAGRLSSTVEMLSSVSKQITSGGAPTPPIVPVTPRRRSHANPNPSPIPADANGKPPGQPVPVRIEAPEDSVLTVAGKTMMPLVHPLTTTLIVVIFLVFILLGREDLRDRALRLAGSGRIHLTTTAFEDASRRVSRYLQMQLVVNLCYGVVAGLCLWAIGIPHPLLWAVLTCGLRFVPYIGILMASAGPLLLSIAVSPRWKELALTVTMYAVLELVTANFVEPMLYGASTGISAIAILIAAIFWTLLWGLPGLLLSTPLTVCLVVIGRQVPRLQYLEVLFGEETVLPAAERFYQRMLASNTSEATALLEDLLKTKSREEVYDDVLIPALTLIEESRHAEEMTGTRADEVLQGVEEVAEDVTSRGASSTAPEKRPTKRVICLPARDFADEVACQLALQVLTETASVRVISADCTMPELLRTIEEAKPEVICVVGVPPRAIRHIRMRCHQVRRRFPETTVVACVLSNVSDLSNLRSRIPTEDAQHVVCSLHLMKDYLSSLLHPEALPEEGTAGAEERSEAKEELKETIHEVGQVDVFDGPEEELFNRLATNLARSFDAPIALITVTDGERHFWEAQCGLPEDTLATLSSDRDLSICSRVVFAESSLVVADTAEEEQFANDPFLKDKGIRFYAGAPLKTHEGQVIGSLCVLDTWPRQVTEQQKEALVSTANSVMTAIELHGTAAADEEVSEIDA